MNANITRRITLNDVFTARQSGEQDAQTLLDVMAEFVTEAGQPDFSGTAFEQSLYPIIDLAQKHRVEECMARLEGFAAIIGPVLERIAGIETEHAILSASQSATQAERITPEEQRAVNAAISTCSMASAGRIIATHPNDDDATVTLCELQLAELARYFTSGNDQLGSPLFELRHPGGNVWRLYADGRCEGLPDGVVVVNHALPIIHELIAKQIPRGSVANE